MTLRRAALALTLALVLTCAGVSVISQQPVEQGDNDLSTGLFLHPFEAAQIYESDPVLRREAETARFIIANPEAVAALKRQDPVYAEAEMVALFGILNPSVVQEERHKNPELKAVDERILRAFVGGASGDDVR